MKLLPIGTIINVNEIELMIVGYREIQNKDKFVFCYVVSVFPIGYTGNEKSVSLIPIKKEYEVVYRGLENDVSLRYIKIIEERYNALDEKKPSDIEQLLDLMINEVKSNE